jgi:hypothetical protein
LTLATPESRQVTLAEARRFAKSLIHFATPSSATSTSSSSLSSSLPSTNDDDDGGGCGVPVFEVSARDSGDAVAAAFHALTRRCLARRAATRARVGGLKSGSGGANGKSNSRLAKGARATKGRKLKGRGEQQGGGGCCKS